MLERIICMNFDKPCGIINISDRKTIQLTGVVSVDSFDEYNISMTVSCGTLNVEGEGLNITTLDLDKGHVSASGTINGVYYNDSENSGKKGLALRLFGKGR